VAYNRIVLGTYPGAEHSPHWPQIEGLLAKAAGRSGSKVFDPGDTVWVAIEDGRIIAAATSQILDNGDAELCHVSGERAREWVAEWDAMICHWAKAQGARNITTKGRKGWERLGRPLGWQVTDGPDEYGRMTYMKVL
jgi:hypothetical protein